MFYPSQNNESKINNCANILNKSWWLKSCAKSWALCVSGGGDEKKQSIIKLCIQYIDKYFILYSGEYSTQAFHSTDT